MWLVGVVSRRRVWLVGVGGIYGCGYFLFMFIVLVPVLFCNYILCINNFFAQYKHTYGQLRTSHSSHMKAAHNVLYMKKHTQTYASYPAMDISCMTSRSVV